MRKIPSLTTRNRVGKWLMMISRCHCVLSTHTLWKIFFFQLWNFNSDAYGVTSIVTEILGLGLVWKSDFFFSLVAELDYLGCESFFSVVLGWLFITLSCAYKNIIFILIWNVFIAIHSRFFTNKELISIEFYKTLKYPENRINSLQNISLTLYNMYNLCN